jgi:hypothetical protein
MINKKTLQKEIKRELFFLTLFLVIGGFLLWKNHDTAGKIILFFAYPIHLIGRVINWNIKKRIKSRRNKLKK